MIRRITLSIALLLAILLGVPAQQDDPIASARPHLVLATADTPPFSSRDGSGVYDRLLHQVFDSLHISLTIRHLPSERGLLEANQGRVDGEFARTQQVAEAYANLIPVSAPLSIWDFVTVTRSGTPLPTTFAELRDYHVAFINGWKIFESNVADYRSLTLVEDEEQLFAMLLAEHVDVVLYGRRRAEDWIRRHQITTLAVADEPLARQPMYLLLHNRHADLIPQITAELMTLREFDRNSEANPVPGPTE